MRNGRSGAYVTRRSSSEDGDSNGEYADEDLFEIREHAFFKTNLSKLVNCRACMEPTKKGAILYSHCSLIARSSCAGRGALTGDLRSKLLMHTQFAEHGSSPAEIFTRLQNHHPASASSSRFGLDRECANSPQLSPTTSSRVLSPFKRSRASLTPDLIRPSLPRLLHREMTKVTIVIPEGNIARRKLSIILTCQREPQQTNNRHLRERPQSRSSNGSPQSQASQSPQSNSLRSLLAVVATKGNTSSNASSASRAARVDPSAATTSLSFVDADAAVVALEDPGASCVTVLGTAAQTDASTDKIMQDDDDEQA